MISRLGYPVHKCMFKVNNRDIRMTSVVIVLLYLLYIFNMFFYLIFGYPTANFVPLSRGHPHSPDVNHGVLSVCDGKGTRAS